MKPKNIYYIRLKYTNYSNMKICNYLRVTYGMRVSQNATKNNLIFSATENCYDATLFKSEQIAKFTEAEFYREFSFNTLKFNSVEIVRSKRESDYKPTSRHRFAIIPELRKLQSLISTLKTV